MSRLLLKPLDWQTDDEHVAAVQLSRVALLGAIEVVRCQSARGRESISPNQSCVAGGLRGKPTCRWQSAAMSLARLIRCHDSQARVIKIADVGYS